MGLGPDTAGFEAVDRRQQRRGESTTDPFAPLAALHIQQRQAATNAGLRRLVGKPVFLERGDALFDHVVRDIDALLLVDPLQA